MRINKITLVLFRTRTSTAGLRTAGRIPHCVPVPWNSTLIMCNRKEATRNAKRSHYIWRRHQRLLYQMRPPGTSAWKQPNPFSTEFRYFSSGQEKEDSNFLKRFSCSQKFPYPSSRSPNTIILNVKGEQNWNWWICLYIPIFVVQLTKSVNKQTRSITPQAQTLMPSLMRFTYVYNGRFDWLKITLNRDIIWRTIQELWSVDFDIKWCCWQHCVPSISPQTTLFQKRLHKY